MRVKNIKNEQKEVLPSIDNVEEKSEKKGKILLSGKGGKSCENSDCPSNFFILCLKSIKSALQQVISPEDPVGPRGPTHVIWTDVHVQKPSPFFLLQHHFLLLYLLV